LDRCNNPSIPFHGEELIKKLTILFITIFILCLSIPSFAADYYISQSAAGSGDGSSCANADALADLTWGAGNMVDAGDTLHLCGTITSTLTIGASGTDTTTNAITIKWEDGAKLSKTAWGTTTSSAIYATGKSYLIFDGGTNGIIENTDNGTALGSQQDSYLMYFYECSHVEIKNLTMQNVYVRTASSEDANAYGRAVSFANGYHDIKLHDCTINDGNKLVMFGYTSSGTDKDIYVYNNVISNSAVGITVGSSGTNAVTDNINIYDNNISRSLLWSGVPEIHTDLVHLFTAHTGTSITNAKIYGNRFSGDCGTNVTTQLYVEGNVGTISAPLVYNNVFTFDDGRSGSCGSGAIYLKSNVTNAMIANNTFIIGDESGVITSGIGAEITNNIFTTSGLAIAPFSSTSSVSGSDYNSFSTTSKFLYGSWSQINLDAWKTATNFDSHSITDETNLSASYYPQSTSPVLLKTGGTDLSATFTTDKDGNTRTTWNAGAYGYDLTGDVTAPTVSAFTIPETASSLTISISSITCTDAVGVTGYCINESSETPTSASCSGSGWSASAQTGYTFSTSGEKTLYGWCKDAAGNISSSSSDTTTITLITSNNSVATKGAGGTGSITIGAGGTGSGSFQQ